MLAHRTIYAAFANERDAERAAGALMDHGVSAQAISFVLPHDNNSPIMAGTPHIPGAHRAIPNDLPIPDMQIPVAPVTAAIDLNTGSRVGEDVSLASNTVGYHYDALGAEIPDASPAVPPTTVPAAYVPSDRYDAIPINTPLRSHPDIPQTDIPAISGDTSSEAMLNDRAHIVDQQRVDTAAAHGITTTTGRDAAKGAAEGAGIGLGLGALLGLAAIAIPGVGWVAGAGAIVAGLAAATGAAGAVAGGAYGFLADLGLPPHVTQHLQTHLESGGPVLSIHLQDGSPESELLALLTKYGATSAQAF